MVDKKEKKVEYCRDCGAPRDWDMLTNGHHDKLLCEGRQLIQLRVENKKLKKSLEEWKDAWFHLREIIGKLWWWHPAIDSDEQRAYYQNNQQAIANKRNLDRNSECQKEQVT